MSDTEHPDRRCIVRELDFKDWQDISGQDEHSWLKFYRAERRWLRIRMRQEVNVFFNRFVMVKGKNAKGWKVDGMLAPVIVRSETWDNPLEEPQETKTGSWIDDQAIIRVDWHYYVWMSSTKYMSNPKKTGKVLKGIFTRQDRWQSKVDQPQTILRHLGMCDDAANLHQELFTIISNMSQFYEDLRKQLDTYIGLIDATKKSMYPILEHRRDRDYLEPWGFKTAIKRRGRPRKDQLPPGYEESMAEDAAPELHQTTAGAP